MQTLSNPIAMLAIPSFYRPLLSNSLAKDFVVKSLRLVNTFTDEVAIFVSAQTCSYSKDYGSYVCDHQRSLRESILIQNIRRHLLYSSSIAKIVESIGLNLTTLVLHTELRIPRWNEDWFLNLYCELLQELPILLSKFGLDVRNLVVEIHPGYVSTKCYEYLNTECRDIRLHAKVIHKAILKLRRACSKLHCMFTLENRSGSPRNIKALEKRIVLSNFRRIPQATATFYDILQELKILFELDPELIHTHMVGATLDLPQHLLSQEYLIQDKQLSTQHQHLNYDVEIEQIVKSLKAFYEYVRAPALRSIHVHWFKGTSTHSSMDFKTYATTYLRLATSLYDVLDKVILKPLIITPEALTCRNKIERIALLTLLAAHLVASIYVIELNSRSA